VGKAIGRRFRVSGLGAMDFRPQEPCQSFTGVIILISIIEINLVKFKSIQPSTRKKGDKNVALVN
jgi:hypothetical protein